MTNEQIEIHKLNVMESVVSEQFISIEKHLLNKKEIELKIKYSYKGDNILYNRKEKKKIDKAYKADWESIKSVHKQKLQNHKDRLKKLNIYENGTFGILTNSVFDHLTKEIG